MIGRTWIPARRPYVLKHLASAGLLASSNAPVFSTHGGRVPRLYPLTMTATNGAIYYTTNGADPRVPFLNTVSSEARLYVAGTPVVLDQDVRIQARSLAGTNWSAVTEAAFQMGAPLPALRIAEIMYHPPGGRAYEFVELLNAGSVPVDVSGMWFEGIAYRFAENSPLLPAGGRLLLISDFNPPAFAQRYPWAEVAGVYQGSLGDAGQALTLKDGSGQTLARVAYQDSRGWPAAADGGGRSLEFMGSSGEEDDPAQWRSSAQPGGSPGVAGAAAPESAPLLNEILARQGAPTADPPARAADWIELYNPRDTQNDLTGLSISINSLEPGQWTVPNKTVMAPKGYLRLWCDHTLPASVSSGPELNLGHSLDAQSGAVYLFNSRGQVIDAVEYGFQAAGLSIGRSGGAWQLLARPTPGATNAPPAALGLPGRLRINEWMAGDPTRDDWFELYNPGPLPVSLTGLYLTDDPSLAGQAKFLVGPLAYIAGPGWVQWVADGQPAKGRNHAGFKLDGQGETLRLYDSGFQIIDSIDYTVQFPGASQGRWPDGEAGQYVFYQSTPGLGNSPTSAPPDTMHLRLTVADAEERVTLSLVNPPAGAALVLQMTTNLVDWISIQTNAVPAGRVDFRDETVGPASARFYRVMAVP